MNDNTTPATTTPRTNGNVRPAQQPQQPPRTNRMTLAAVTRGVQAQPLRVVIYGPGGVGKSTFGAQAPNPIFLGPENGSALLDVARFPQPHDWTDVLDAIRTLTVESHDYQSLVIDSADWLEPLCWAHTCAVARKPDIESFGFGKGYVAALEEWRRILSALEAMRRAKRTHIVVIAHGDVKPFKNPDNDTGGDYDRWQLKLHKGAAGLLTEWCDELAFATFRTFAQKVDPSGADKKRARGIGSERVLYTERRAAFDAKSRHGLPPEMPLSWDEFFTATQRGADEVLTRLQDEVRDALARLDEVAPAIALKARAACDGVTDVSRLSTLLNTIRARVQEHTAAPSDDTDTNNSNTANA